MPKLTFVCTLFASLLFSCPRGETEFAARSPQNGLDKVLPPTPSPGEVSEAEMKNVHFRFGPNLVLQIRRLRGQLVGKRKGLAAIFDDKNSFIIRIDSAETAITTSALTDLMNRYVFAYPGAPIKNLKISAEQGELELKGTMVKALGLPFEIQGRLEATPQGKIRFRAGSIKTLELPIKGLFGLFHVKMEKFINLKKARGVSIQGNDLILDPQEILPPPGIRGGISAVRLEGDRVVQVFGSPARSHKKHLAPSRPHASNYMYFRGGMLRFGKLTMTDSDLQIIDQDPSDPFDFFLDRYNAQLVAGYSKNTPDYGLVVFMPDSDQIRK